MSETVAFSVVAAEATKPLTTAQEDDDSYNPEEEVIVGDWKAPKVEVTEVKSETGEEHETVFWKHRVKLFRWAADSKSDSLGQWKERGLGEGKLLQHKETRRIRFLLRQEKTLKIVANHYVVQTDVYCKLTPNVGSDKIWVWTVMDFADDELKNEQFALKFGQAEQAQIFKQKFEEAVKINQEAFREAVKTENGTDSKDNSSGSKENKNTEETKDEEAKDSAEKKEE